MNATDRAAVESLHRQQRETMRRAPVPSLHDIRDELHAMHTLGTRPRRSGEADDAAADRLLEDIKDDWTPAALWHREYVAEFGPTTAREFLDMLIGANASLWMDAREEARRGTDEWLWANAWDPPSMESK